MIFSTAEWEEEPGALSARRGNCAVSRFTAHGLLAHSTARVPWPDTHLVMCEYIFSFGGARRRGVSSCSHVCGGVATRSLAVSQNAPRHWGWRGKSCGCLPPATSPALPAVIDQCRCIMLMLLVVVMTTVLLCTLSWCRCAVFRCPFGVCWYGLPSGSSVFVEVLSGRRNTSHFAVCAPPYLWPRYMRRL